MDENRKMTDASAATPSAGKSGFDLVTVNASPHLGRQIPKGLWRPLDKTQLHNLGNVDAKILQMLGRVDPGNRYAIPYMWGTTGLIYNPEKIRAMMPDAPVDSFDMVFGPDGMLYVTINSICPADPAPVYAAGLPTAYCPSGGQVVRLSP